MNGWGKQSELSAILNMARWRVADAFLYVLYVEINMY
jgi:hypothetical protein